MIHKRTTPVYDPVVLQNIKILCRVKGIDPRPFVVAYKYFENNPHRYDGATIVKDLVDCNGIDLSAMRHDFEYIRILSQKFCILDWIKYKILSDLRYGKNMERFGKGVLTPYGRTFLLWISTPLYPLWKYLNHPKTKEPKRIRNGKPSTTRTDWERK